MRKIDRPGMTSCPKCRAVIRKTRLEKHLLLKCRKLKKEKKVKVKRKRYTSETYQNEYLRSSHWQDIRKRMYSVWKWCRICGSKDKLNIHHITYARLGFEKDTDLIVVCQNCHINRIHQKLITKKELNKIVRTQPYAYPR